MGNEKKNGSLQQQNKTYKNSNNNKQTNKQKQNKIGKIQRQKKTSTQIVDNFLFHCFTYGALAIPMFPLYGTFIL